MAMDIERTMQFILENLATATARLEKMTEQQSRMEERQSELDEEFTKRILAAEERHDHEMASIRAELRRGIRFSVEEHRRERVRRHELEEEMKARHAQHERNMEEFRKSLQRWLDRGGNGHPAA